MTTPAQFSKTTLTPALSHPMGEGESSTASLANHNSWLPKACMKSLSHPMGEGQGEGSGEGLGEGQGEGRPTSRRHAPLSRVFAGLLTVLTLSLAGLKTNAAELTPPLRPPSVPLVAC